MHTICVSFYMWKNPQESYSWPFMNEKLALLKHLTSKACRGMWGSHRSCCQSFDPSSFHKLSASFIQSHCVKWEHHCFDQNRHCLTPKSGSPHARGGGDNNVANLYRCSSTEPRKVSDLRVLRTCKVPNDANSLCLL